MGDSIFGFGEGQAMLDTLRWTVYFNLVEPKLVLVSFFITAYPEIDRRDGKEVH